MRKEELQILANILRRDVLEMTTKAGSGHPTSCLSCAEIMATLFFDEMKWDVKNPDNPDNDEFILSKGHAAPILYSALFRAGAIKNNLMSLRKLNSELEGHPTPRLKFVKVATGSLGQGASIGVGMALAGKMQKRKYRTYVLLGDSEMAEGSNYESLEFTAYYKLNNLCLIVDVNRLGQRGATMFEHDMKKYEKIISSFGLNVEIVDGHNVEQIKKAFERIRKTEKPSVVLAKTIKGKGVSFLENKNGWHGKALDESELKSALKEIPKIKFPKIKIAEPKKIKVRKLKKEKLRELKFKVGEKISTREAYGRALANLAFSDGKVIAVDAEVSNSTKSEYVKKKTPSQFVEAFIAEQDMVGVCLGLSKKGFNVFGSTFATFLSRAHDQIRMSALSNANFTLCGSHAGVSIGEDGASQMGLEDIALFRTIPNSVIFYPSDATSAKKIVELSARIKGIKYIRTTRNATETIYPEKEKFEISDFKVLRSNRKDKVVLVGSGITLHECLKAAEKLEKEGIKTAVVDLYCIKPFNSKKFIKFVREHGGKVVVVEDHYPEGGIGEMLAEELENTGIEIKHLAVRKIPHSGKSEELLSKYGIDSAAVVKSARKMLK